MEPRCFRSTCWIGGCVTALFLVAGPVCGPAQADSWAGPSPFEVSSANGLFLARVERSDRGRPRVTVSKLENGERASRWDAELVNRVQPVSALVSDDGEHVVTFDNWHSVGYGPDVIVFYGRRGLIRNYSLEAALAGVVEPRDFRVAVSVSSRWWNRSVIHHFDGRGAEARFGVWIDWAAAWVVWKLADGSRLELDEKSLAHWNELGRRWAHAALALPEVAGRPGKEEMRARTGAAMEWSKRRGARYQQRITACRFLAYSGHPEDRRVLEGLLEDEEFNMNWELELRTTADRALAIQDGLAQNFPVAFDGDGPRLYRLGNIDLTVEIPAAATEKRGQVYVSVLPGTVGEGEWREAHAAFRGGSSFGSSTRRQATDMIIKVPPLEPGRYWVKVVWDRTPPHVFDLRLYEGAREWKESRAPAPMAEAGDLESGPPEPFEVKAGQRTAVRIKCVRPGTNAS